MQSPCSMEREVEKRRKLSQSWNDRGNGMLSGMHRVSAALNTHRSYVYMQRGLDSTALKQQRADGSGKIQNRRTQYTQS